MSSYGDSEAHLRVKTRQDIGTLLRERRPKTGLDHAEPARRIGVSRHWLIELEGGKPRAEIGLMLRALDALDIPLEVGAPGNVTGVTDTPDIDSGASVDAARKPQRANRSWSH